MKYLFPFFSLCLFSVTLSSQLVFEKDLLTTSQGSNLLFLTKFDERIIFYADDGIHGQEPHIFDPKLDVTYLLADINPGVNGSLLHDFVQVKDIIYFIGIVEDKYFLFQLLSGSKNPIKVDLPPEILGLYDIINFENKIYFSGFEESGSYTDLYCYDPNTGETRKIINTSNDIYEEGSSPIEFGIHKGELYMNGRRSNGSLSLLKYNITKDSITLVDNQFHTDETTVFIQDIESDGQHLILTMRDPEDLNTTFITYYDEATESIVINPEAEVSILNDYSKALTIVDGEIYFAAKTNSGSRIRTFDIETNSVEVVNDISDSHTILLQNLNDKLFFIINDIFPRELRTGLYDPITQTIEYLPNIGEAVDEILPRISIHIDRFIELDNSLFFRGNFPDDEDELLRYDMESKSISIEANINKGTLGNVLYLNGNTENDLLLQMSVNNRFEWHSYNIKNKELTSIFSDIDLQEARSFYQFPRYIIATNAKQNDKFYHLIVYDSLSNDYTFIEEYNEEYNQMLCVSNVQTNIQPYMMDDLVYFTYCDGNKWQLANYDLGSDEFEIITNFTNDQLSNPSQFGTFTMANADDKLYFTVDPADLFYQSRLFSYDGIDISQIDFGGIELANAKIFETKNAMYVLTGPAFSNDTIYYASKQDPDKFRPLYYNDEQIISNYLEFSEVDSLTYFINNNKILSHNSIDSQCVALYNFDMDSIKASETIIHTYDEKIYLVASTETYGLELYQLNIENIESPVLKRLTDINEGSSSTAVIDLIEHYGKIYFLPRSKYYGYELWSYNPEECISEFTLIAQPSNIDEATGSITIDEILGEGPFTFEWSTGATTTQLDNISSGLYSVTASDVNGCQAYEKIWVENNGVTTSVGEIDNDYQLLLYPNPCSNFLNYNLTLPHSNNIKVSIYAINGDLIDQYQNQSSSGSLNVSNLLSGIYVVVIKDDAKMHIVKKIIKQ